MYTMDWVNLLNGLYKSSTKEVQGIVLVLSYSIPPTKEERGYFTFA